MKAKKTARILCALSVAALCLSCVSTSVFAAGKTIKFNGGQNGTLRFNGYDYSYSAIVQTEVDDGAYNSNCATDAAIIRTHEALHGKWLTKNYGYVTNSGGWYETPSAVSGVSRSKLVYCPRGKSQILQYTRVDTRIIFRADTTITASIYKSA